MKIRLMSQFNLRVYGILINPDNQLLLSDEQYKGRSFTKLPGGGLCFGEGVPDGLLREFLEECDWPVRIKRLLYVTESFIPSAFDDTQVIGVYYQVESLENDYGRMRMENTDSDSGGVQSFRWVDLKQIRPESFSFEMDQQAWRAISGELLIG